MAQESRLNPTTKDVAQLVVWLVAVLGGLYGVWSGINESKAHRAQQEAQLRWQQAELARQILEKLGDNPKAKSAMRMLDWSGREFEVAPGHRDRIKTEEMITALRTDDLKFTDKEVFVRDCFDDLFDGFELIEHYVRIRLIRFDDVKAPISYYVQKLNEHRESIQNYLREYDFALAKALVDRFLKE